jgi:hypothetical protein
VPIPNGYTGYLTFLANGVVDPADIVIRGEAAIESFQRQVMKRSEAEIAQVREEAKAFFQQRYGIDENTPGVVFRPFSLNPLVNYRAYVVGGRSVPSEGWVVRDGGWEIFVESNFGVILGGEFTGMSAPPGAQLTFADYHINVTKSSHPDDDDKDKDDDHNDKNPDPIVIRFKSRRPVTPLALGQLATADFEISNPEFGTGKALVIGDIRFENDGRLKVAFRNALTFSSDNGF